MGTQVYRRFSYCLMGINTDTQRGETPDSNLGLREAIPEEVGPELSPDG